MTDPVAEKSGFLRMYMSSHPDTLVAYAKWFGKVNEIIKSAEMTAIDCESMTLTCTLKDGDKKVVVVAIEPPLKRYGDVKPRLLEMKAIAQEGLGMIKAPKITTVEFPWEAYFAFLFSIFFTYLYVFSGKPFGGLADVVQSLPYGRPVVAFLFWSIAILHPLESLYTLHLCRKHSTGLTVGIIYVGATLICGFSIWVHLRKKIQQARIDSVMKVQ